MGAMILVFSILVGLIAVMILGTFRPARTDSRREVVGRPRRRLGGVLLLVGVVGLVGGQWYATVSAADRLIADDEENLITILQPKAGEGDADRYVVRVLTFSDLVPERARLLEHLSFVIRVGERVEKTAATTGRISPGEYDIQIVPHDAPGRLQCHINAVISQGTSQMSLGTNRALDPGGTMVKSLSIGTRDVSASATALFPGSVFPEAIEPYTVVTVDPAPAGVEEIPFGDLMASPFGRRIRAEFTDESPSSNERGRGISAVFASLSMYAWILLALTGVGSALLTARPGLGLGIFLLLAPVLLAGVDGFAFSRQRAALDHEDVRVRASAMTGLMSSVLFGESGPEAVAEAAERRGGVDLVIASRVKALKGQRRHRLTRRNLGD